MPKSQWGFSGGYRICGERWSPFNTRSAAESYFLKPGERITVEDSSRTGGNYMQVFATTVAKGSKNGAGETWHSGITSVQSPRHRYSQWVLCADERFPAWKKGFSKPSISRIVGSAAYDPKHCKTPIPFTFYPDTMSKHYDIVLTPENARKEVFKAAR